MMLSIRTNMVSALARRQVTREADIRFGPPRSKRLRSRRPPAANTRSALSFETTHPGMPSGALARLADTRPPAIPTKPHAVVVVPEGAAHGRDAGLVTRFLMASVAECPRDIGAKKLTDPWRVAQRCVRASSESRPPVLLRHLMDSQRPWRLLLSHASRSSGDDSPKAIYTDRRGESQRSSGTIALAWSLKAWVTRARRWLARLQPTEVFIEPRQSRCSTQDGLVVLGSL